MESLKYKIFENIMENGAISWVINYIIITRGSSTVKYRYQVYRNTGLPYPNMQAFSFMGGQGHCPMISEYGPSHSKAVGPVDPSFLVVKKSHFNKNAHLKGSLLKVHVGCQYSKTCLKQPLKKDKTKILIMVA